MLEPWNYDELSKCAFCPGLSNNHVPGVGPRTAMLMVVGQSPGRKEAEQKAPFVGKSGEWLTMLLTELLLSRDEVYITNTIKCHPPGNRVSTGYEIDTCTRYHLFREIYEIAPAVMLLLGRDAHQALCAKYLFRTYAVVRSEKRSYVSTYHPSYWMRKGGDVAPFLRVVPLIKKELAYWKSVRGEVDATPALNPPANPE